MNLHPQTAPAPLPMGQISNRPPLMSLRNVNLWYGDKQALIDVSFDLYPNEILAFIGPSGCGKSTALKCLNRMHDGTRDIRLTGRIEMDGQDINDPCIDPPMHRRRFGWVAQKPNPFPATIWQNVAYGARLHGLMQKHELIGDVRDSLRHKANAVADTLVLVVAAPLLPVEIGGRLK